LTVPANKQFEKRELANGEVAITSDYRHEVQQIYPEDLEAVHEALLQRLHDPPSFDEGDARAGPLQKAISSLVSEANALTIPLADREVPVVYKNRHTGEETHAKIPLGETVASFKHKVHEKRKELEGLWAEWDEVQNKILDLGKEMLAQTETAAQSETECEGTPGLPRPMAGLQEEIVQMRDQSLKDIEERAREEARKDNEWQKRLFHNLEPSQS